MKVPDRWLVLHTHIGELMVPYEYHDKVVAAISRFVGCEGTVGELVGVRTLAGAETALRVDMIFGVSVVSAASVGAYTKIVKAIGDLSQPSAGMR